MNLPPGWRGKKFRAETRDLSQKWTPNCLPGLEKPSFFAPLLREAAQKEEHSLPRKKIIFRPPQKNLHQK